MKSPIILDNSSVLAVNVMKILIGIIVGALFLSTFQSCAKDDLEINNVTDFEELIQDEMDIQKIPAMSVLIFKGDRILYENYFGKSHIEQNISLQNNHLFLLASISKVVTATALLQLYEKGMFSLDDKIYIYLPFEVRNPSFSESITFRMLLTHTSSIADGSALDNQYYYRRDSPVALKTYLRKYLDPNGSLYNASENYHNFQPGSKYEYSNTGNALIALLVEQITGKNFNTYCKENIFSPLGMTNTFWRLDEISQTIVQPYNYTTGKYRAILHYTFTDYPNGGLRSTGRDMFKFLQAFVNDGKSNNYRLLSSNMVNTMATAQIPSLDNEVGLHLFLMDSGNSLWGHDGGEQGVATILGFNKSSKVGAIIFSNQGEVELDEILVEAYKLGLKL